MKETSNFLGFIVSTIDLVRQTDIQTDRQTDPRPACWDRQIHHIGSSTIIHTYLYNTAIFYCYSKLRILKKESQTCPFHFPLYPAAIWWASFGHLSLILSWAWRPIDIDKDSGCCLLISRQCLSLQPAKWLLAVCPWPLTSLSYILRDRAVLVLVVVVVVN